MVYSVQRSDCLSFSPADAIDPDYGAELRKAVDAGVEVYVLGASISPDALDLDRDGWRWEHLPWSIVPGEPRIAPSTPQAPPIVDLGALERS